MFELPPIPTWDALHPLIIHFPIGLLFIAPIMIVLGIIFKKHSTCLFVSALILMTIGTIAAYVAVSTGEAAGELADRTPAITEVIQKHNSFAETTRLVFTILTIIYLIILLIPKFTKKEMTYKTTILSQVVFLVLYVIGIIMLSSTAHLGGRLVHEFGVRAIM